MLAAGGPRFRLDPAVTFYAPLNGNTGDLRGAVDTFERSSDGLYLDSGGVWQVAGPDVARFETARLVMEPAETNVFLNSDAAATQSISLPLGDHTLSVRGGGSVASSDNGGTATGHGTATDGSPVTIDVTVAGLILFTVSGSPDYVQVESGTVASSPIITQGVAANRAVDELQYANRSVFFNQTQGMAFITYTTDYDFSAIPNGTTINRLLSLSANPGLITFQRGGAGQYRISSTDGTSFPQVDVSPVPVTGSVLTAALRWKTAVPAEFQLGAYYNGSWVWGTAQSYDGNFAFVGDELNVNPAPFSPIRLSNIYIYDEDKGIPWIEDNHP